MTSTPHEDAGWQLPSGAFGGATEPPAAPARPLRVRAHQRLDDYELLDELGAGGMGSVYRARHLPSGRDVALKVIPEASVARKLERFRREGETTAALDHPNIIRIHAAGVCAGVAYQAIELVEGGRTLADVLHTLPRDALLRLLRDTARGLGHAHARGVVHRDVKPANVLLDPDGRPRVADFGLALARSHDRLTRTGEMVGTPTAMAPEQFQGDPRAIGPPADVWALGVILYEGLTGEPPFPTGSLLELSRAIVAGRVSPPRELVPTLPAELERVCLRCLETDPAQRYPDGDALADALDRILAGQPLAERGPGRTLLVAVAALALVLVAALAAATLTRPRHPPPAPVLDPQPTASAAPDPGAAARVGALLERALLDVAFVEAGALHPPLAQRRARAESALREVLAAADDDALAGRAWLGLARLELPPQHPSPALDEAARRLPGDPGVHLQRARRLLAGSPADALAELEAGWPDAALQPREVAWLRGSALLALGRAADALPHLDRGAGHRLDAERCERLARALEAAGRLQEAVTLVTYIQLLSGVAREDAEAKFRKIRHAEMESTISWQDAREGYAHAATSDPLHLEARFRQAKVGYVWLGDMQGLREAAWVARACPRLLSDQWSSLRNLALVVEVLDGRGLFEALGALELGDTPDDLVLRGILAAAGEGDRARALRGLERVLHDEPADVAALTLQGLLLLRDDALERAEVSLRWAHEADPTCGLAALGLGLLAAKRRESPARVWAWFEPLLALDQAPWQEEGWQADFFPELGPYLEQPAFVELRGERR